ncbi:MAG: hypothetical protein KF869_00610 [Phycisphaeraceae bacterium]|nr:hypothetical protein [Phycisphaeraceae bacterium]
MNSKHRTNQRRGGALVLACTGATAVALALAAAATPRPTPPAAEVAAAVRVSPPAAPCGAAILLDDSIPARIWDGIGARRFEPLTTSSRQARAYFEQGLALVYGFNHDEARRSFREAARLDPEFAMAYWGIAHTLGANYNQPGAKERNQAGASAIAIARSLAPRAGEFEQALIAATAERFPATAPDSVESQAAVDAAYAAAMKRIAERFPDHDDALTFHAESMMNLRPWDLWARDGSPHPGTETIVATLERVLSRNADHIGAIHLYIHATESSPDPARSLRYADRLGGLAPRSGHLVHMPSHAYVRTGRWADALKANRRAIEADDAFLAATGVGGMYAGMYAPHNVHFLSWAAMLSGDADTARSAGAELLRRGDPSMLAEMPQMSMVLAWPSMMDARFGRWDAVLAAPEIGAEWTYGRAMRHFARGLAFVGKGALDDARVELAALREESKKTPADMLSFGMVNTAHEVFAIAERVLEGRIAAAGGDVDRAVALLTEAVSLEDALTYMEPADWHAPVRQSMGAVLLGAKRHEEAARVFREDLARTPEGGWSLFGLAAALRGAGDAKGAEDARRRFEKSWAKVSEMPEFGWY